MRLAFRARVSCQERDAGCQVLQRWRDAGVPGPAEVEGRRGARSCRGEGRLVLRSAEVEGRRVPGPAEVEGRRVPGPAEVGEGLT